MATLLDRGIAAHIRRQKAACGRNVVYRRGSFQASIPLWPGSSNFNQNTVEPGAAVIQADRTYLIAVEDLFLGGANVLPEKGDRITETIDGQDYTFEIMLDQGKPVWEYNDSATRQILRVYTNRVK